MPGLLSALAVRVACTACLSLATSARAGGLLGAATEPASCADSEHSGAACTEREIELVEELEAQGLRTELLQRGRRDGAKALETSAQQQAPVLRATQVCVYNSAGFVLKFQMWDTATNKLSDMSEGYPAEKEACMDIATQLPGVEDGHPIAMISWSTETKAMTSQSVIYDPSMANGPNGFANFTCKGFSTSWTCNLKNFGTSQSYGGPYELADAGKPQEPLEASGVCVDNDAALSLKFSLWDTATNVDGDQSGTFMKGKQRCVSGQSLWFAEDGNPMVVNAKAVKGKEMTFPSFIYNKSAEMAEMTCTGGTMTYKCVYK
jgi:hypothetical protein